MVSLGTIIAATIIMGAIFLRRQIGEAGTMIGSGAGELGLGLQTLISSVLSPSIRPAFIPTIGVETAFPDSLPELDPRKIVPQGCQKRELFKGCPEGFPNESNTGFPYFVTYCCPSEGDYDPQRNGERIGPTQDPARCPNPADPRCDVFLDPYVEPSKTFRECYQRELTDQEFSGLVSAGAPCEDVAQYEYILGNTTGAFDVGEIASRLGFRDLTTAQASNIRLGQTGLGALTQAYRSGEIGEDILRSGFRETIR